ncbi:MAG TPA: hypothetical protein VE959_08230 [Bryobacteraceae bacterium]|nr:hypothetical protein [Bryobacteraceae bacterium]
MPQPPGCLARLVSGCLTKLLFIVVFGGTVMYAVIALTHPWALHIGGRRTPLFTWFGSGKLVTRGGLEYPLFVVFYPARDSAGLNPGSSVQGSAVLCTSPGVAQPLQLRGALDGVWPRSTEGRRMTLVLSEPPPLTHSDPGPGFVSLVGTWHGSELPMDAGGARFRSGLRIEQASVTLKPGFFWPFNSVCASAASSPAHR